MSRPRGPAGLARDLSLPAILAAAAAGLWAYGWRPADLWVGARLPLVVDAAWHFAATWLFVFIPRGIYAKYTSERPTPILAVDAMQFLGGMNSGFCLLAVLSLAYDVRPIEPVLAAFALANFSQFALDLRLHRARRVNLGFLVITVGDAVATVVNLAYCAG